ncbi:uncharacterized protein CMC5_005770 [Chondromyces crocatus]|uniref:HTH araC/xylS-type domain-containing protein n=1 Tax=Chondromyces crocatus TaxID=52 RepID=A0A0K1E6Y6_CHOCO|nr:uncharacterized protein CMC5_005770 [Chondromyces crocatus]
MLTWTRILGLSLVEVAHASGLPRATLEAAEELSYEETLKLWTGIEALTGDPVWGIHAGAQFTIDQMGVVGPALAHATHLDAALDVLVRVMNLFVRNAKIRRIDTERCAGFEYVMPTLRSRQGADTIFAAAVALIRHCTGECVVPHAIEHQMPRQSEDEYLRIFGVVPRWDRPTTQLLFARADLARPFRGASPVLAELLSEHAPRLLAPSGQPSSFDQDFACAFWRAHESGGATLEAVAEAMETTARTLQRKLAAQKTSFAAMRAELLHRRTTQLLTESTLPIDTIAERLGYSSRAALERAYRRWSGRTPHAVRAGAV